jgi:hypothetical protein
VAGGDSDGSAGWECAGTPVRVCFAVAMAMPFFPHPLFFLKDTIGKSKNLSKAVGENWEIRDFCSFWKKFEFYASILNFIISF